MAVLLTGALGMSVAPPAAAAEPPGTVSLAEVLTADGDQFDSDPTDYDIVTEAVLAVLTAKPGSAVGVLTDGTVPVTAFIPNDLSFKFLVKDLTGRWYFSEEKAFNALVDAVGVDAVESVLLYHVVPGVTIDSRTAFQSDGAVLPTALEGSTITVDVVRGWCWKKHHGWKKHGWTKHEGGKHAWKVIRLRDGDPDDIDPFVNPAALDINEGNLQIAHGIFLVLRPIDL